MKGSFGTAAAILGGSILAAATILGAPSRRETRYVPARGGLPVFPGAEGFGAHTPAGRGGRVIEVTSLADSGPGSLREALEDGTPGPRMVVFRVGGTIELVGELYVNYPYVTIAGQTAPGDGILLKNAGLVITANDVLVQHLRIRPGNEGNVNPETNDAIQIFGRHGDVIGAHNVVIDHVSASWSEDEAVSTWFAPTTSRSPGASSARRSTEAAIPRSRTARA